MIRDPEFSALILLTHYSFDLQGFNAQNLTSSWLYHYPQKWVIAAIVEALYQGRYKADSVSRILSSWQLKGHPMPHFDHEFADIAYKKLMRSIEVMERFEDVKKQEESAMKTKAKKAPAKNERIPEKHPLEISELETQGNRKNIPNPGIREWARLTQRLAG